VAQVHLLEGATACIQPLPKVPHEYFVRRSQYKIRKEDVFKQVIGTESLYEISDVNGVRVVNFAMSKNLIVKSTVFPCF
jgi:hypothetical protein